jgi:hypothetical protein
MTSDTKKSSAKDVHRKASKRHPLMGLVRAGALGALITAVVQEFKQPKGRRTWHGQVWGFVPYDLRPPSFQRFRRAVWSPDDRRIIVPMAFGVGWTINLGRLLAKKGSSQR